MSTIAATNLKNASSGSNNIVLNTDGSIGGTCLTQTCRAWVNFNGTGTVAIRASYNVSSITDNGVGDYTVNFTAALADANYTPTAALTWATSYGSIVSLTTLAAGSLRVGTVGYSVGNFDPVNVCISIFR